MHRVLIFALAVTSCLAQLPPGTNIVRLSPSDFPQLPPAIATELQRRGCKIPQVPLANAPNNVIKGEFTKPGQIDWAVLCSINQASSILVFWRGSATNPTQIENHPDEDAFQSSTNGEMVYSRMIKSVAKPHLMNHYQAIGSTPPVDHQGINDELIGKAATVLYFTQGRWLHLRGAD